MAGSYLMVLLTASIRNFAHSTRTATALNRLRPKTDSTVLSISAAKTSKQRYMANMNKDKTGGKSPTISEMAMAKWKRPLVKCWVFQLETMIVLTGCATTSSVPTASDCQLT